MTMDENFHIVVEGGEDLLFLKGCLNSLQIPFSDECFKDLEGWKKLDGYMPTIEEKQDKGVKVLIIFDANTDREARMKEINRMLGGVSLPVFLFPDDRSEGDLEDILIKTIAPENKGIFKCFENYKECLGRCNHDYTLPNKKGKVYAYKEATGALRKRDKENQFNPKYWDFGSTALNPLKKFLTEHIG